ncbi:MAG: helix-turn-helix domain-containing protein [Armatimonadota bacterium]
MAIPAGFMGFTPAQAAKFTGLTFRTVDNWDRTGLIIPSLHQSRGRGITRAYSFPDLVALRVAAELRSSGITVQSVRKVIDYLKQRDGAISPLSSTLIVTDGVDVYEPRTDDELLSLLKEPGQGSIKVTLDLKRTIDDLTAMIEAAVKTQKTA